MDEDIQRRGYDINVVTSTWVKVYNIIDIDTIAIRSESDVEIPEGLVLSGRRIYHYRVSDELITRW